MEVKAMKKFLCALAVVSVVAFYCMTPSRAESSSDTVSDAAFPGQKSQWNGYDCFDFTIGEQSCKVVAPKQAAEGKPWVWRAVFWGHEPQTEIALLGKGYHVAYIACSDWLGSPKMIEERNAFYEFLTKEHGLSKKPVLLGMSRGGLCSLRWATENSDRVSCLYIDAPVCDFQSWPGGKDKNGGKRSADIWQQLLKLYNLTEEEALASKVNPVNAVSVLAEKQVPILSVCGDSDGVVPYKENTIILFEKYKAAWKAEGDAPLSLILKPGVDHHPHSLKDPTPIVEFIINNTN